MDHHGSTHSSKRSRSGDTYDRDESVRMSRLSLSAGGSLSVGQTPRSRVHGPPSPSHTLLNALVRQGFIQEEALPPAHPWPLARAIRVPPGTHPQDTPRLTHVEIAQLCRMRYEQAQRKRDQARKEGDLDLIVYDWQFDMEAHTMLARSAREQGEDRKSQR